MKKGHKIHQLFERKKKKNREISPSVAGTDLKIFQLIVGKNVKSIHQFHEKKYEICMAEKHCKII